MSVTIDDISKHLGVSVSTVSKALNNYRDVSPQTKNRVLAAAQELGYHPSAAARNLRRQRTDKIGFLYSFPTTFIGEFASRLINGAVAAAEEQSYNLTLYPVREDWHTQLLRICRTREIDGLLIMGSGSTAAMARLLREEKMPFVVLNRRVDDPDVSFVSTDHQDVAYQAARHLIELGYRRIVWVTREGLGAVNEDQRRGYQAALAEAGIPFDPALLQATPMEPGSARSAFAALMEGLEPPFAVVGVNDAVAIECMEAAQAAGLSVPGDFAAVGSDNVRLSLASNPPLTTLHPPLAEIGRLATRALFDQILDRDAPPVRSLIRASLVVRRSTVS